MSRNFSKMRVTAEQLPAAGVRYSPVLVAGMHNSGTSILAKIIHNSGIFLCPDMGHYECRYFSHFLHDDLILGSKSSWATLPLPDSETLVKSVPRVRALMETGWQADFLRFGYDGVSPWGFKDPRLCLLLPMYLEVFPDARVVAIERDPLDVAASLTERSKAGVGYVPDIGFWTELVALYAGRLADWVPRFAHHHTVSYEELCKSPDRVIKDLASFLEIPDHLVDGAAVAELSSSRIGSFERHTQRRTLPRLWREARAVAYPYLKDFSDRRKT